MRIKRAIDGYFFGGTPTTADALAFYGVLALCIIVSIVSATVNVLQ